jgi:hypothetical protein
MAGPGTRLHGRIANLNGVVAGVGAPATTILARVSKQWAGLLPRCDVSFQIEFMRFPIVVGASGAT